jgi:hypothetical protein
MNRICSECSKSYVSVKHKKCSRCRREQWRAKRGLPPLAERTKGDEVLYAAVNRVENLSPDKIIFCPEGHARRADLKTEGRCNVCAKDTWRRNAGLPAWKDRQAGDTQQFRKVAQGNKVCRWCRKTHPEAEYLLDAPIPLVSESCSACRTEREIKPNRKKPLRYVYLTQVQREALLDHYGRKCRVCDEPESELAKPLAIDHCHTSGKIRGVLCNRHNLALGLVADSVEELNRMAAYLANPWE